MLPANTSLESTSHQSRTSSTRISLLPTSNQVIRFSKLSIHFIQLHLVLKHFVSIRHHGLQLDSMCCWRPGKRQGDGLPQHNLANPQSQCQSGSSKSLHQKSQYEIDIEIDK